MMHRSRFCSLKVCNFSNQLKVKTNTFINTADDVSRRLYHKCSLEIESVGDTFD